MDDSIRVSDADRDRVTAQLRDHFAAGRITPGELDERLSAALNAKTFGDLRGRQPAHLVGVLMITEAPITEIPTAKVIVQEPFRAVHEGNAHTAGDEITVVTSISASSVSWLPFQKFMSGKTLTGQYTLQRE